MLIALDENGKRIAAQDAQKGNTYKCECCGGEVLLKKGDIKIHHFSHIALEECDEIYDNTMCEWHMNMQNYFLPENIEIVYTNDETGERRRADARLEHKGKTTIIEFQHSPMSKKDILARSEFYTEMGMDVVWVFDLTPKEQNVNPYALKQSYYHEYPIFQWNYADKNIPTWDELENCYDYEDGDEVFGNIYITFYCQGNIMVPMAFNSSNIQWGDSWKYFYIKEDFLFKTIKQFKEYVFKINRNYDSIKTDSNDYYHIQYNMKYFYSPIYYRKNNPLIPEFDYGDIATEDSRAKMKKFKIGDKIKIVDSKDVLTGTIANIEKPDELDKPVFEVLLDGNKNIEDKTVTTAQTMKLLAHKTEKAENNRNKFIESVSEISEENANSKFSKLFNEMNEDKYEKTLLPELIVQGILKRDAINQE